MPAEAGLSSYGIHGRAEADHQWYEEEAAQGASDIDEDSELAAWAEQFDAKVDALTARQDAFLKYLDSSWTVTFTNYMK